MSEPDLSSHAPLDARLRGRAFLAGVHYVSQADAWMREAADRLAELEAENARLGDRAVRAEAAAALAYQDAERAEKALAVALARLEARQ